MTRAEDPPVAVDVSRLVTGLRYAAPTGIERWELGYASRLTPGPGVILSPIGARALSPGARAKIVLTARRRWRDDKSTDIAAELAPVTRFLRGEGPGNRAPLPRRWRAGGLLPSFARAAFTLPALSLPRGCAYIHANFFRLESPRYFDWLSRRPDIKPVFVIYDLLPISDPQFFRPGEDALHRRRIETAMRRARAVVVPCETIAGALRAHVRRVGLPEAPIHVVHTPIEPEFLNHAARSSALGTAPYFVVCGTLEPRKNHALLLEVWRRLAAAHGPYAPKLVIVGRRGWRNEAVFRQLDHLGDLASLVLEAGNLSTASLASLIGGAQGLLSPSFAEGYGIPIAEALALGTPVIAADNEVYRELWQARARLVAPDDAISWADAVEGLMETNGRREPGPAMDWDRHTAAIRAIVAGV